MGPARRARLVEESRYGHKSGSLVVVVPERQFAKTVGQ